MSRRPDAAGILAALGEHERARTLRTAAAMHRGERWAAVAFPASRVLLNGRTARRSRPRTGRDWRTQPRAEGGQWAPFETTEAA